VNSRVEEVVVQISRESARERERGFFLFRCLIPLFLFFLEIFISPTFSLKDLVLGFSVFLSLFLLLLWGSSELGTNGGERWVWFGFEGHTPPPPPL
jgi:cell division protein FtsW (lipid II flippase)